ncbi:SDR family NAD(P)-dependent oxidoreductase [Rhodococcus rhodochrous]|uniref:SDR family NAD(P)-dependent oxidoreductase n=1 Tax=Rhodococcus rhodochrous TaxID=1829 RepID=UPI0009C15CBD|nr:SDR family oxidoreductase [Rhodococcus rhodochrous]
MDSAEKLGLGVGSLRGRVALVTGSGSGIGRATASLLAELGATVVALDRVGQSWPDIDVHPIQVDLSDLDGLEEVVADVTAMHGDITALVNAAGIAGGSSVLESTIEEWERLMRVDLTAPFVLTKAVGRRLLESQLGGNIVNVGSSSAVRADSAGGAYGAAKAGLSSLTRSSAWELGKSGVNVNLVAPGITRTELTRNAFGGDDAVNQAAIEGPLANLLARPSESEDIAAVIAFLCLPASRQITGQVIHVSAGAVIAAG